MKTRLFSVSIFIMLALIFLLIGAALPTLAQEGESSRENLPDRTEAKNPTPYGLHMLELEPSRTTITIDGSPADWAGISPIVSDAIGDPLSTVAKDDIVKVFMTHDGSNLYFRIDLATIGNTYIELDIDVDQNTATGYDTTTPYPGIFINPHNTGIDYTIEVGVSDGYANLYLLDTGAGPNYLPYYIGSIPCAVGSVVEVGVPFDAQELPFNLDFQTFYNEPQDEAPNTGYVTYPRLQYNLTINVSPAGSGTTNPTAGTHTYDAGTVVNISATPNAGYRFGQWNGNASGTDQSTTVTMDSDKDVTANFVRQYTLTMSVSPAGSGTTTPTAGTHTYDEGTIVELTATPNPGYRFSHWSGDASGTEPSATVTMDSNKSVTANFVRQYTLTMHVSPTGSGTTDPSEGTHTYDAGTVVNLTATPNSGYRFSQWSGNVTGTNPITSVTMNSNKDVTANFVRQYTLTMHVSPAGSGTTVPAEGTHTYDAGTVVNLSAAPTTGYRFSQWSGDVTGSNPTTSVTMNSDKDVTANFVCQYTLTIHVSPAGSGTTIPAAGTHTYDAGTVVNLSATPGTGYRFSHWSGDASGTDPSTTVTMDSDKDVTANFVRQYTLTMRVSPAGSGTTTPAAGTHTYDTDAVVELIATPNSGYRFSHWSGNTTGTEPVTSITIDSNKDVTANFMRQYTLTMHVSPAGGGNTTPAEGSHAYDAGTVVNLTATPNSGYRFSHWSGNASGTNPSTAVTMNSDKDVTANFVRQYTLTIRVSPVGSGTTTPTWGRMSITYTKPLHAASSPA